MQTAFKEWAIIVDALGHGEQILILRKGGISEECGGFQIEQPEFWIFPTFFHQQWGSVVREAKERFDQRTAPVAAPETQRPYHNASSTHQNYQLENEAPSNGALGLQQQKRRASSTVASGLVRLMFFARVIEWRRLDSLAAAERLRGQHIWRDEVVAQRFDWGRQKHIHALAVQVFRLPKAIMLPMAPAYGGCKSWIELETDLSIARARAVLDDTSFGNKLTLFRRALPS